MRESSKTNEKKPFRAMSFTFQHFIVSPRINKHICNSLCKEAVQKYAYDHAQHCHHICRQIPLWIFRDGFNWVVGDLEDFSLVNGSVKSNSYFCCLKLCFFFVS